MKRVAWIALTVAGSAALVIGLYLGWNRWRGPGEAIVGGKPTEAWLEALRQEDAAEGARTADTLAGLGEPARPILLEARKDSDLRVHRRAVRGLTRLGGAVAPELVEALPRGGARVEVALARLGPDAIPALEKGLRDPSTAAAAARVLADLGPLARAALPALVALLHDPAAAEEARVAVAFALGRLGPEKSDGPPEVLAADPVIAALTAALSGSTALKREAARALGRIGTPAVSAVGSLRLLARDSDEQLASIACIALGNLPTPAAAEPLVSRLYQGDRVASTAALALARLGPQARKAVGALLAALKSDKSDGRLARAVLERLGTLVVADLAEALQEKEPGIRRGAAEVLGLMGPRARLTVPGLRRLLEDPDPSVAVQAALALVRIDPERAGEVLPATTRLFNSKDASVADQAAIVLAELGEAARPALPDLLAALKSKEERTLVRAANVLARMQPPGAGVVAALAAANRPACVQALGRLGPPAREAIPTLQAALKDATLRPHAALALVRTDPSQGKAVAEVLAADLGAGREPMRGLALAALSDMEPVPLDILPALRPLLGDRLLAPAVLRVLERVERRALPPLVPDLMTVLALPDPEVQRSAAGLLAQAGERAQTALRLSLQTATPATRAVAMQVLRGSPLPGPDRARVQASLEDADEQVRRGAAWLLASQPITPELLPVLRELTASTEAELRQAGVWGLGKAAPAQAKEVLPMLLECLADPDDEVRRRAVDALGRLGGAECIEELRLLLRDPAPAVRLSAAEALHAHKASKEEELAGVLIPLAREATPAGRREVIEVMEKVIPGRARVLIDEVAADVRGDEVPDRIAAARWLARLDRERIGPAVAFLIGVLNGWDARARAYAALTLGEMGVAAREAVPALRRRQDLDEDRDVRLAARHALTEIGVR